MKKSTVIAIILGILIVVGIVLAAIKVGEENKQKEELYQKEKVEAERAVKELEENANIDLNTGSSFFKDDFINE